MQNDSLAVIEKNIFTCTKCSLCMEDGIRVPGEGNIEADLFIVGESPGFAESKTGHPFVGSSGRLLNRILSKVGIQREDIFISNVIHCRPPNNRTPLPQEISSCIDYVKMQIQIINPKLVCLLGNVALKAFFPTSNNISKVRGEILRIENRSFVPTFHPSYILRNLKNEYLFLEDFEFIKEILET